jgi:hypothetical protein
MLRIGRVQRDGALRYVEGSAPAQMKPGLSSLADEIRAQLTCSETAASFLPRVFRGDSLAGRGGEL